MLRLADGIGPMPVRARSFTSRAGILLGSAATLVASAFIACNPAPVVVSNANDALLTGQKNAPSASASASTAPPATAKKNDPLLVPDQSIAELPPFACPPEKRFDLLGQTFCVNLERREWHDAEAECQKIGAHLAVMKNSSLPNALRNALISPAGVENFWIGLAEPSEGRWIWSNGTPLRFSAFRRGEPNNAGRGEDCAEWLTSDGRWNDADCFQPRHFLCEGPTPPAGSRIKGITCNGKRFTIEKTDYCLEAPATWDVAQRTCVRNGGELAMVDTDAENNALFKALGSRISASNFWIGLSDEASEGQFRWISGDPLEIPIWRQGEPNNAGGAENCAEWSSTDARWNDLPCRTPLPSLCEKPPVIVSK